MRRSHETWLKILGCAFVVVAVMCVVFALILANVTGEDGADGADGADGITITDVQKTTEGNVDTYTVYYSDDTTYSFTVTNAGKGDEGVGISTISKTTDSGSVDTYTIYLTDGSEYTFDVTNGNDGDNGDDGDNGTGIKSIDIDDNYTDTLGAYGTANATGTLITITLDDATPTTDSFFVPDGEKGETGDKGDTGLGIKSIEKTGTSANGLTDTYTITYTDDSTSTYTVANGNYITGVDVTDNKTSSTYTYKFTMKDGTTVEDTVTYTPYITSIAKDDADTTALKITYSNGTYATISGVVNINAVKTLTYSNGVLSVTNTDGTSYDLSLHCVNHSFVKISTLADEAKEDLLGADYKDLTDIAATCNSTGVTYYYCTVCGEIHSEITEATGHKYDQSTFVELSVSGSTMLYGLKCTTCETYSVVELGFTYTAYNQYGQNITSYVSTAAAQVSTSGSSNASLASARLTAEEITDFEIAYYGVSRGDYIGANPVIPSTYNGYPVKQIDDFSNETYKADTSKCTVTIGTTELTYAALESVTIPSSIVTINDSAFKNCKKLTTVTFSGSGLKTVGQSAFKYCTGLTSITIPASTETIGDRAFEGCTGLATIDFESSSSLTTIENYAFQDCSALTSIVVPDSVTTIETQAFGGCSSLESITLPFVGNKASASSADETTLFGYIFGTESYDDSTAVTQKYGSSNSYSATYYIPTTLTTVNLTGAGSSSLLYGAFYNCKTLTSVTIPSTITSIGDYAFYYCNSLASISLDGVLTIGNYAFYYCSAATDIAISGVSTIGNYAFQNCTGATTLTVTNSGNISSIGNYAFGSLSRLATLNWNVRNLSNSLTSNSYLFNSLGANSRAVSVYFGDNVKKIPKYLFCSYSTNFCYVTKVYIGSSVEEIGSYAFNSVHNSTVSGSGLYLTSTDNWFSIKLDSDNANPLQKLHSLYSSNGGSEYSLVTSIIVPESIKYNQIDGSNVIGDFQLAGCTSVTTIYIPSTITQTGYYAFSQCSNLKTVYYQSTLENYYKIKCYSISEDKGSDYTTNASPTSMSAELYCLDSVGGNNYSKITSVTVSSDTTVSFYGCSSITSVTIADGVTSIQSYMFTNCSAINKVTFEDNSDLTAIGETAFSNCNSLTNVYITDLDAWCATTFEDIYSNPLYRNNAGDSYRRNLYLNNVLVTDISGISSTTTSISAYAFAGCSLTSITIPDTVTSVGSSAFYYCTKAASLTIGSGLSAINEYTFYYCDSITSLTIPDNVTSIGSSAFANCRAITSLAIPNTVTALGSNAFSQCSGLASLTIGSGITTISNYAFSYCTALTSVTVPNTVGTIGDYAFSYCTSLKNLTIGTGVTKIGVYAFRNCTALTAINYNANLTISLSNTSRIFGWAGSSGDGITVTIGSNVTSIPNYLFYSYTDGNINSVPNIVKVVFDGTSTCTSIGDAAFKYVVSLEEVTLPDSVTSIGAEAFKNCYSLTTFTITTSSGLTTIGGAAFQNCESLTNILIPSGVTSIGDKAFDSCFKLALVNNYSSTLTITAGDDGNGKAGYYAYVVNSNGTGDGKLITQDGYTFCYDGSGNYYLIAYTGTATDLTLPTSLSGESMSTYEIGKYAFEGNTTITSVVISDCITAIGNNAFNECTSLTSVTIGSGVTSIGVGAFGNCTSLTSVTFSSISGWYVTTAFEATEGTDVTVDTAGTNVTYLITDYVKYYWYRSV